MCVLAAGSQGEWVWVDTDAEVAIGARVKVTKSGQRLLVDDDGKVNTGAAQKSWQPLNQSLTPPPPFFSP